MKKFNAGDLVELGDLVRRIEISGWGEDEEYIEERSNKYSGLRLFVVGYDGERPVLSFEKGSWEGYQEFSKIVASGDFGGFEGLARANYQQFRGRLLLGFSEDSLTLIRAAANKTVDE